MTYFFHSADELVTLNGVRNKDGRLISDRDLEPIKDGAMWVDDAGLILSVGSTAQVAQYLRRHRAKTKRLKVKSISLSGRTILPAFCESHTHLLYAGNRADEFELRNTGVHYAEIADRGGGIRSTVRATRLSKWSQLEKELIDRLNALVEQGVTAVEVKTGYFATIEEELNALKNLVRLRDRIHKGLKGYDRLPELIITSLAAHWLPDGTSAAEWLQSISNQVFPFCAKHAIRVDIFVDKGAFSVEKARQYLLIAQRQGLQLTLHAEQLERTGASGLGLELRAQSVDHLLQLKSESDFSQFRHNPSTVATLLPAADLYTRLPYPNARRLIESGACVALATDHNPGSSPALDLALVGVLARTQMQMSLAEVLSAYTYGAAKALGLEGRRGSLTPGCYADFLVLRQNETLSSLFYQTGSYRGHPSVIEAVFKKGRSILRKKNLRSSRTR